MCTHGFRVASSGSISLLQDLGYIVLSLHVVVQENMCRVTLDHGESREAHFPKQWLLCMSFREAEVYTVEPGHSSAFQVSPTSPCLVRQVPAELPQLCWIPTQLHQLSPHTLSNGTTASSLLAHVASSSPDCMASLYTPDLTTD